MLPSEIKKLLTATISNELLFALSNSGVGRTAVATVKTVSNNTAYIAPFSSSKGIDFRCRELSESDYSGIWVGSGNTPPSENDYFLETPITSGLTGTTSGAMRYDAETNSLGYRLTVTINNTGSNSITISEIARTCLFNVATAVGESLGYTTKHIMIDRCLLSNPVTIPAGTAGVIYYDFVYYTETNETVVSATGA